MFPLFMLTLSIFSVIITGEKIKELNIGNNVLYLQNVLRPTGVLKFSLDGLKLMNKFKNNSIVLLSDGTQLVKFHKSRKRFNNTVEYEFVWFNVKTPDLEVCFHYGYNNASWYSTYEAYDNRWPINAEFNGKKLSKRTAFITGGSIFGPVIEYLFVNTDGFAVMLDHLHPWFIRFQKVESNDLNDEPLLCFSLGKKAPYEQNEKKIDHPEHYYSIKFKILSSSNIRAVHQAAIRDLRYIDPPKEIPSISVMKSPSWNTQFTAKKENLNFEYINKFAQEISNANYSHYLLVIDGADWENRSATLAFKAGFFDDKTNPTFVTSEFNKFGFKVAVFVRVFVDDYIPDLDEHYLVRRIAQKDCKLIDFTDQRAADLFVKRLNDLRRSTGVYTFKFVQGHVDSYKNVFVTKECAFENGDIIGKYPNLLTTLHGQTCARLGSAIEIQSAFRVQHLPLFVRGQSKKTGWTFDELGIQSELVNILTLSIAGYSFYKSDFICANDDCSDELFIRWMQAVTFFPGMQFSIPPWNMENVTKVTAIVNKMMQLRAQFMPKMLELSKQVVQFGEPLIRPMWYEAPDDPRSYAIWDQYMLGSDLLVAPVVDEGKIKRDVYFPPGTWRDQHNKDHVGSNIETISAPLEELPYFVRA